MRESRLPEKWGGNTVHRFTLLGFYVHRCLVCMTSVCNLHVQCKERPEEGARFPRTGVTGRCKLPYGWMLGIETGSSERPARALNQLSHPSSPESMFKNKTKGIDLNFNDIFRVMVGKLFQYRSRKKST